MPSMQGTVNLDIREATRVTPKYGRTDAALAWQR